MDGQSDKRVRWNITAVVLLCKFETFSFETPTKKNKFDLKIQEQKQNIKQDPRNKHRRQQKKPKCQKIIC